MILPPTLLADLGAAVEMITRGDASPAWLNAAASVLEICARDIRALTSAETNRGPDYRALLIALLRLPKSATEEELKTAIAQVQPN